MMEVAMTSAKPARIDDVRVLRLTVQELTPEAFAPYGEVSEPRSSFRLDFSSQPASFCHVRIEYRPLHLLFFARHLYTTQSYVPLGGSESVLVVAPPSDLLDTEAVPDLARAAAFRLTGGCAVNLHRGTWHRTPMPLGEFGDFMVLDRDGTLDDLDLVDLCHNLGVTIEIDL
jgi:ureidoglycolate lyase